MAVAILLLFLSVPAYADKKKALEFFDKGTVADNLGRFPSPPPPPSPRKKPPPPPPPRVETELEKDPLFVSMLEVGVAYVTFGDLQSTATFRARIGASLPFRFGRLWLEPGISGAITPVRYEADSSGTSILSEVYGNVTAAFAVHENARIRVELGAGALVMSGLKPGNPFTDLAGTTGPLSMFSFQAGIGADFMITRTFSIGVTPFTLSMSPPKAGLLEAIDRIQQIGATAGISLRL